MVDKKQSFLYHEHGGFGLYGRVYPALLHARIQSATRLLIEIARDLDDAKKATFKAVHSAEGCDVDAYLCTIEYLCFGASFVRTLVGGVHQHICQLEKAGGGIQDSLVEVNAAWEKRGGDTDDSTDG